MPAIKRKYPYAHEVAKVARRGYKYGVRGARIPLAPPRTGGYWGIKRRMGSNERKTIDVDRAAYVADTTGTVTLISGVANGADFTERIGRKILMKSIYVKGFIFNIDNTTSPSLCRLILVYDNQTNGAAPAITDILKQSFSESQLNLNNRDRFKIISDKTWVLGGVSDVIQQSIAGSPTVGKVKIYKKCNYEEVFNGITNAVGSIATGAVWMVTIGNVGANAGGNFTLTTRIRFIDG